MCAHIMKVNRSVGSVLEFRENNEPQNRQESVIQMNNKVAATCNSKTMELPGDI